MMSSSTTTTACLTCPCFGQSVSRGSKGVFNYSIRKRLGTCIRSQLQLLLVTKRVELRGSRGSLAQWTHTQAMDLAAERRLRLGLKSRISILKKTKMMQTTAGVPLAASSQHTTAPFDQNVQPRRQIDTPRIPTGPIRSNKEKRYLFVLIFKDAKRHHPPYSSIAHGSEIDESRTSPGLTGKTTGQETSKGFGLATTTGSSSTAHARRGHAADSVFGRRVYDGR
jgi:hypothetical protein